MIGGQIYIKNSTTGGSDVLQRSIFKSHAMTTLCLVLVAWVGGCSTTAPLQPGPSQAPQLSVDVSESEVISPLWAMNGIVTTPIRDKRQIVASQGVVAVYGTNETAAGFGLLAFDGRTGEYLWSYPMQSSEMEMYGSVIYVAPGTSVIGIDSRTGELLSSVDVQSVRSIANLHSLGDGLIWARADSDMLIVDVRSAEVVARGDDTYSYVTTNEINVLRTPIPWFSSSIVLYSAAPGIGHSAAFNRDLDRTIWRNEQASLSNVVGYHCYAFTVALDDYLEVRNIYDGAIAERLPIAPSLDYSSYRFEPQAEEFHLAIDGEVGILYALFGISDQLFAFSLDVSDCY